MEEKIQLQHPLGKKAVSISIEKYEVLKKSVLKYLEPKIEATFSDIEKAVIKDFETNKIKFEGSLSWYLEWVKLDLEAKEIIAKIEKTSPQKYVLVKWKK